MDGSWITATLRYARDAGDEAEAVFYMLNVGFNRTDPAQTEEGAPYRAVCELHEERPREG